jgi:hypothetical protein
MRAQSPLLKALVAQMAALASIWLAASLLAAGGIVWPAPVWLGLQSLCAATFGVWLGLPVWWAPILALFVPALMLGLSFRWSPWLFLAAFAICWLAFRGAVADRVPLYLSNETAWRALADLLPQRGGFAFADLGSGLGGTLAWLARQRPDGRFHGVESAWGSFVFSRLRLRGMGNVQVRLGSLWTENLGQYDVVYVFLSPEPMPRLWKKAREEMRPGCLLVSNSFEIPGVAPDRVMELEDARRTRLSIWIM